MHFQCVQQYHFSKITPFNNTIFEKCVFETRYQVPPDRRGPPWYRRGHSGTVGGHPGTIRRGPPWYPSGHVIFGYQGGPLYY